VTSLDSGIVLPDAQPFLSGLFCLGLVVFKQGQSLFRCRIS
jgi:hypothetical protein